MVLATLLGLVATVAACAADPPPSPLSTLSTTAAPTAAPTVDRLPTSPPIAQKTPIQIPTVAPPPGVTRIATVSCRRNAPLGPALEDVAHLSLEIKLWLGDSIYADTEDMAILRSRYELLGPAPD